MRLFPALLVVAFMAGGSDAYGQDLEPRAYSNAPTGMNFLVASYGYATGEVTTDPSLPIQNAELHSHTGVLAYVRSLDVWGKSGKVDLVLSHSWLSGSADVAGQPVERDVSGFGDPKLRVSVNLVGAPATSLQEFRAYRQNLILGASLQVTAPLSQYDSDKLVNIGSHRWTIKPALGLSKAVGRLTLEVTGAVSIFTDNSDFFGGQTREQDPIYSMQGHAVYSFRSGIWAALDGTYYSGGRTTVDGVEGNDLQENTRLGATISLPVNRRNSVKVVASSGTSTRVGGDFDTIGIAWQYRWGGGF